MKKNTHHSVSSKKSNRQIKARSQIITVGMVEINKIKAGHKHKRKTQKWINPQCLSYQMSAKHDAHFKYEIVTDLFLLHSETTTTTFGGGTKSKFLHNVAVT